MTKEISDTYRTLVDTPIDQAAEEERNRRMAKLFDGLLLRAEVEILKFSAENAALMAELAAPKVSAEMAQDAKRLDWLEDQYGLHRALEILYVVDGYELEFTYDGNPTDRRIYHGETLREAIDKAMLAAAPRGETE